MCETLDKLLLGIDADGSKWETKPGGEESDEDQTDLTPR
jgi:hypothetical protein